jgi:CRP-like cAMP-binding protein
MQQQYLAEAVARERLVGGRTPPLTGITAALANTRLFSLCSKRDLRTVAKVAKIRNIPRGSRVMTQDEAGETMFVILSGVARVTRNGRKVATLGAGDSVGELAVISRTDRNATVDADTDLEVAEIGRRALARLLADVPAFSQKLLEALASRIRELDKALYC